VERNGHRNSETPVASSNSFRLAMLWLGNSAKSCKQYFTIEPLTNQHPSSIQDASDGRLLRAIT
jgi:hypothetical protein